MGPRGMVQPMIGEMFGDIRGYGFGLEIPEDPTAASMVLTASILMPGRQVRPASDCSRSQDESRRPRRRRSSATKRSATAG